MISNTSSQEDDADYPVAVASSTAGDAPAGQRRIQRTVKRIFGGCAGSDEDAAAAKEMMDKLKSTLTKSNITNMIQHGISKRNKLLVGDDKLRVRKGEPDALQLHYESLFSPPKTTLTEADIMMLELRNKMNKEEIEDYRNIEERMRKDYDMFRDIVRQETAMIRDRHTAFAIITGFLWATIGLVMSALDGSYEKSLVLLGIVIFVAVTGMLVSIVSYCNSRYALKAMKRAGKTWSKCKGTHVEALGGKATFEYLVPQLIGLEDGDGGGTYKLWSASFLFTFVWLLVLVGGIALLISVAKDKISFG